MVRWPLTRDSDESGCEDGSHALASVSSFSFEGGGRKPHLLASHIFISIGATRAWPCKNIIEPNGSIPWGNAFFSLILTPHYYCCLMRS